MGSLAAPTLPDPVALERSYIFNQAHSANAFWKNIDLAFVVARPPLTTRPRPHDPGLGPHALIGWVGRPRDAAPLVLSLEDPEELEVVLRELQGISQDDVVKADPSLLQAPVIDALGAIGYHFEIPGTEGRSLYGWQDENEIEARAWAAKKYSFRHTMGLVAGENQSAGSSPSVVLQNINDQWFPQSELGAYGFVGGARLIRGEPLFFVDSSFRVYRLVPERPVTWDELKLRWGSEVAKRARNDRKSLVVRLELLS